MRRALRFTTALVLGLALVTWVAWLVVQQTTRDWFEKDLRLRAELALNGARPAVLNDIRAGNIPDLERLLDTIARDERVMGAAVCTPGSTVLVQTGSYPPELGCDPLEKATRASPRPVSSDGDFWETIWPLPQGNVHITVGPIFDEGSRRAYVILVHDLSFIDRREAAAGRFLLITFGFFSLAAAAVTIFAARMAFRGWSDELRRLLRGGSERPEFRPILRDVRELIDQIVADRDAEQERIAWTPDRLKQTLSRHLQGEKVIVVANREPYIHERDKGGAVKVLHPASGLVTALEPIMRACSGVWIAHGSGSADRQTVDRHDRVAVPPHEESYFIRRVWLNAEEEKGYYYGFANEGLWPLCHIAHTRPVFRSEDYRQYRAVNEKFAAAMCAEVDSEDPIVFVQDYHFALAPRLIRERLPRATIIMVWHIPWPNSERWGICPWNEVLLEGMLGASIVGFHTQYHCNNFIDSVDRFLEARIDREHHAIVQKSRSTQVRPYPISIEWPSRWSKTGAAPEACRAQVLADLGLPPETMIGVGVDRLDYTKGIEERLLAVERLLERFSLFRGRFVFVQIAAPSRTMIDRYRQLNEAVEQLSVRINERFGHDGYRPIVLLRMHHEPPDIFRYYRAADVVYVSSLHDGMNLVAKEFVAARDDERGVLVLSQFTGAARELTEALIVNPYDLEEASSALAKAVQMSAAEQRERMRSMRAFLAEFNVYRWAGRMLADAARLRSRDRLTGRLIAQAEGQGVG